MYDQNDRLTIDGAKRVIANGGSVLIGGMLHNDVRTLPSAVQLSTYNAVTRKQAEDAITATGSFKYKNKTYTKISELPDPDEFEAANREAKQAAREQLQKEIDDRQKLLDEADEHDNQAAAQRQQAEQKRNAAKRGTIADTGDDAETFGHGENQYPLSHFDGMSDEQVLATPGIGDASLKDIRKAQKKAGK